MRHKLKTSKGQINAVCTRKEQSPSMCSKVLTSHDYHVGQCVVYQGHDSKSQQMYSATLISLGAEKGTYMITDTKGAMYKERHAHLKPSTSEEKSWQSTQCEHMWPVKPAMTQSSHMQSVKTGMPQTSYMWPVKIIGQSNHKKSQVKPAMAQLSHLWLMSNAARK